MEESVVKPSQSTESEALIARRLQSTLQVVREDEIRFKRILEVRSLERRAKRGLPVKGSN